MGTVGFSPAVTPTFQEDEFLDVPIFSEVDEVLLVATYAGEVAGVESRALLLPCILKSDVPEIPHPSPHQEHDRSKDVRRGIRGSGDDYLMTD